MTQQWTQCGSCRGNFVTGSAGTYQCPYCGRPVHLGIPSRPTTTGYSPKVIAIVLGAFALLAVIVAKHKPVEDPELERALAGMEETARQAEAERAKQAAREVSSPASPATPSEGPDARAVARDLLLHPAGHRKLTAVSKTWDLSPEATGDKIAKAGELCETQGHARIPTHQGAVDFVYAFQADDGSTQGQDINSVLASYVLMGCPVD